MTKKRSVYHDGRLSNSLAAGADVSMLTQFYSLHFNAYNMLSTNQFGLETDLTGWAAAGEATISRVSPGVSGSYCIKATGGDGHYDGFYTPNSHVVDVSEINDPSGLIMMFGAWLKGTGKVKMFMDELDSSKSTLNSTSSSLITLTSTFTANSLKHTLTDSDTCYIKLFVDEMDSNSSYEIYGDGFIVCPHYSLTQISTFEAPSSSNRYALMVIKGDPTTIKSDSIPASSMTGLGVYDQMQPPTTDDYFVQLAREWHKPTQQALALQSI
jgi:hypothetical protein